MLSKRTRIILAVLWSTALLIWLLVALTKVNVTTTGDKMMSAHDADIANSIVYTDIATNYPYFCSRITDGLDILEESGSVAAHTTAQAGYQQVQVQLIALTQDASLPTSPTAGAHEYTEEQWKQQDTQLNDTLTAIGKQASQTLHSSDVDNSEKFQNFLKNANNELTQFLQSMMSELTVKNTATQNLLLDSSCALFIPHPDSDNVNDASVQLAAYTHTFTQGVQDISQSFTHLFNQEFSSTVAQNEAIDNTLHSVDNTIQHIGYCTPNTVRYTPTRNRSSFTACTQANDFLTQLDNIVHSYLEDSNPSKSFEPSSAALSDLFKDVEGIIYDLNYALPAPNQATQDVISQINSTQ